MPEQGINGIFNHPREPGPKGMVVEMGDSKILLNDIPEFRDSFVTFFFIYGEFSAFGRFSHNAIFNTVHAEKFTIRVSMISFIGINLLDGVLGMATAGDTERKIGTVMVGGRGYFRSKNKPIMGIDGGMLFKSKVGLSFLTVQSDSRSRENLRRFPFLSSLPAGVSLFCFSSSSFSLLMG